MYTAEASATTAHAIDSPDVASSVSAFLDVEVVSEAKAVSSATFASDALLVLTLAAVPVRERVRVSETIGAVPDVLWVGVWDGLIV